MADATVTRLSGRLGTDELRFPSEWNNRVGFCVGRKPNLSAGVARGEWAMFTISWGHLAGLHLLQMMEV